MIAMKVISRNSKTKILILLKNGTSNICCLVTNSILNPHNFNFPSLKTLHHSLFSFYDTYLNFLYFWIKNPFTNELCNSVPFFYFKEKKNKTVWYWSFINTFSISCTVQWELGCYLATWLRKFPVSMWLCI